MFKEMSKEELQQLWSETMGDKPFPMNRSENSPLDSFYPIDKFIVFMKEGKPISGLGYSTRDGFSLRGGAFTIPEERGEGVYKKVSQEADRIIPTPYIAGFSSSNISSAEWNQTAKDNGWSIKPTDEELGEYANNPTIKAFKDYYDNHPKGASWGVKGLSMKKWFSILKSYRMEMGSAGYNVLDASGKVLNYKGLSRSQAKTFITELQEGKDVSRFTTKPRKSIRGNWFNQLKKNNLENIVKVLPPSHYFDYASAVENDGSHIPYPPKAYDYGTVRVIVRGHYLKGVHGNHGTSNKNTDEIEKWVDCVKDLAQGNYWFYRKEDVNNYEIILVDIYTTKGRKIAGTKKEFNRNMRNPETGELITKIIVFTNYFDSLTLSQLQREYTGRKKVDCFYQGIKPNHPKGQAILEKEPEKKEPKEKPQEKEKPKGFTLKPYTPKKKNKNKNRNRKNRNRR